MDYFALLGEICENLSFTAETLKPMAKPVSLNILLEVRRFFSPLCQLRTK